MSDGLQVLLAAGRELTSFHISPAGRPLRTKVLLTLPEDEAFHTLTSFHEVICMAGLVPQPSVHEQKILQIVLCALVEVI